MPLNFTECSNSMIRKVLWGWFSRWITQNENSTLCRHETTRPHISGFVLRSPGFADNIQTHAYKKASDEYMRGTFKNSFTICDLIYDYHIRLGPLHASHWSHLVFRLLTFSSLSLSFPVSFSFNAHINAVASNNICIYEVNKFISQ